MQEKTLAPGTSALMPGAGKRHLTPSQCQSLGNLEVRDSLGISSTILRLWASLSAPFLVLIQPQAQASAWTLQPQRPGWYVWLLLTLTSNSATEEATLGKHQGGPLGPHESKTIRARIPINSVDPEGSSDLVARGLRQDRTLSSQRMERQGFGYFHRGCSLILLLGQRDGWPTHGFCLAHG